MKNLLPHFIRTSFIIITVASKFVSLLFYKRWDRVIGTCSKIPLAHNSSAFLLRILELMLNH